MVRRTFFILTITLVASALSCMPQADPGGATQAVQNDTTADQVVQDKLVSARTEARIAAAKRAAAAREGMDLSLFVPPPPGGTPDYFGIWPNYANSPIIQKFIDSLPGLGPTNANNLGQYLVVANPDTITYPGSDYYEIGLVQYAEKMHSQLPPTRLRGYVQLNNGTDPQGHNTIAPAPVHYLGPVIVANRDKPVRIKFTNMLPTGAGGNLFIPVDTTVMGAGMGPDGTNYSQNRATLHLHGGFTPWISDGTPHQWTTPAGEQTSYPKGVSVVNVPDMPDPGPGSLTFFYTNQQSARLMFYHDHAYGLTRLNVYAGEAAGYLIKDPVEQALVAAGTIPAAQIPLIIQDKTFVDETTIAAQDPTWNWGTTPPVPHTGDLWFPHVYMPNQNPADLMGAAAMGRWDYGPWFWPPLTAAAGLIHGAIPSPVPGGPETPGTPNPSLVPEAFMDTPVINGTAYPYVNVEPKAYRFRILNACNDRFLNLQLYYADPTILPGAPGYLTEVKMVAAYPHLPEPPDLDDLTPENPTPPCAAGVTVGVPSPTLPAGCWPSTWPTDGRDGGVPDPLTAGPSMIQIGTEGGLLPAPVVLDNTPIGYDYNRRSIVVLNVTNHTLFLGPAERADVIVDFSQVPPGSTLILYNDAPAPVPAFDPRNDYYTGDPDQSLTGNGTGGAPSTLPGFGPNTRTILQIRVAGTPAPAFNLAALQAAFASTGVAQGAFAASQDPIVIPQDGYNSAYNAVFPNDNRAYARIQDTVMNFTPLGAAAPLPMAMQPKAIQELFELNYGRMNATLGVELPFTNMRIQTTVPYGYIDPPTEIVTDSVLAGPPVPGDGTQIWKITHNGVDTHAIHFHLFNVQLINRVGWDGMVKPPELNELGWKETIRMNPLEDAIVAFKPRAPTLPFKLPDSVRPLDVTMPLGSNMGFTNIDPITGNPITVLNTMVNYGWEYVWHCHLLGHEENDMMRPLVLRVAPTAPTTLTAAASALSENPPTVALAWVNTATNPAATMFTLQRATDSGFTTNLVTLPPVTAPTTAFTDTTVATHTTYYYRVRAEDAAAYSPWTDPVTVTTLGQLPAAPTNLVITTRTRTSIALTWTDNAANEQGYYVERARDVNGAPSNWNRVGTLAANTTAFTSTGLQRNTIYWFRVQAFNADGPSAFAGPVSGRTLP